MRLTLRAADPLSLIAEAVGAQRPADAGPFVLRVPFPRREYATPEELQTSIREAALVPRGAMLVLPEQQRGVVIQGHVGGRGGGRGRGRGASMATEMAAMMQAMADMPNGVANPLIGGVSEDADYEELTQLEEALGGAVARGLTPAQMRSLTLTTLDAPSDDEQRCCICCCEFVAGDRLMTLHCRHGFHPECIGTWLAAKTTCPMCKQPALGPEDST